ncbi:MAG: acetolactate synthase large subunit [Chloroflexi bacterium]|nr:acetolactate synthase large subunit [Chloroflexota bacterium]
MNAAELFVQCLENEGVTRIFGVPGEENAALMMAIDASVSIEFVLTRHEQGAAFMAEVHGRLTGEPGVCLGTLGPGAANLVTGVADANMDRAPLIAITGQVGTERWHKESHQAMDVVGMFKPITKWASTILTPHNVPEVVHKAFKLAVAEKPGACHIELPEDVASAPADDLDPIQKSRPTRPVPDRDVIFDALQVIRSAKSPVILAGNGVIRQGASAELTKFAETTGIGVINTFMAKGAISQDSMNSLYTIGLAAKDMVFRAIHESDLVITVGYDMVEYPPIMWNAERDKKIIHLDFVPAEVDENYRIEVEVVGDLPHALLMLNDGVHDNPFRIDETRQHAIRHQMMEDFATYEDDDTKGPMRPQKVLADVRKALGPSDVLLSDVGAHKMWVARQYQCYEPNTCLIPNGFASMGFALPGLISAAMVDPTRKVMAVAGDGGFLMNVQEMETARRLNSDITVMVWEDGGYGLIEWKQNTTYGTHTDLSFGNPKWGMLAESFGWSFDYVDESPKLLSTIESALNTAGPSLIVIPIDYRENAILTKRLGEITMGL